MAKTIWVLVADEAIARLLRWPDSGDELVPVEEWTDPAAHASGSELRRDAYGRRDGGGPPGGGAAGAGQRLRSGADAVSSAGEGEQHQEAEAFARRVAEQLATALQEQRYDELRIAAAPRFLGLLRKALSPQVAGVVSETLNKDLVHEDTRAITRRLFPAPADGGTAG